MSVFDVAEYVLEHLRTSSAIKLQKLVYYAQAWNIVAYDEPLFDEPIIAHQYGPLCTSLWEKHRGRKSVSAGDFSEFRTKSLSHDEEKVVDAVLAFYGGMSMTALVDRTHQEEPWKQAYPAGEEISLGSMRAFYVCELMSGHRVPTIQGGSVSYVDDEEFESLVSEGDEPDDYSGFVRALAKVGA